MVKVLHVEVGRTGYGLSGFHWPPSPIPPEKAIPIMKRAFESGARLWSAAEFYGTVEYNSLHLLAAYFTKYPEDAKRVILSLKIGMDIATRKLTTDAEGIKKSIDTCESILGTSKKIDIISCARVDPEVPVEESVGVLADLVKTGKVGAVGLSECSAETVRRAAKVTPIAAVEVEFSMFSPEILSNGVAEAAADVGAVIVAYSPLGRGVLTGSITGLESLDEKDPRRMFPRFQKEALEHNLKVVGELRQVADRVGSTNAQAALAWIRAYSDGKEDRMPRILPIPGTTNLERLAENMKEISLGDQDFKALNNIVEGNQTFGTRYPAAWEKLTWG